MRKSKRAARSVTKHKKPSAHKKPPTSVPVAPLTLEATEILPERLSTTQAAKLIGVRKQTLIAWRHLQKKYPDKNHPALAYYRIGGRCFYSRADVEEFIRGTRVAPASQLNGAGAGAA